VTFAGAPATLVGGAFAFGAAALIALYVLKLRRRRVEVPFAHLWRRVLRDTESTALWRRLRRLVSLALQLLVLALLVCAIGDPRLAASDRGRTVVLLIDTSASMQTLDGADAGAGRQPRTRLDDAREHARRLVRGLGGDDAAMLVALDAQPAPITGFTSDDRELLRALDGLAATDAPADLERGLRLAADALRGRPRPTLILVGDGAWDPSVLRQIDAGGLSGIDLGGADLRFEPVGHSGDNLAITAFAVRRYRANASAYEVLVEVQSFRERASEARLELLQDGEVVEVQRLALGAGERVQRLYPNLAGEGTKLEARLVAPDGDGGPLDALPLDDHAYALLPPRKKLQVQLVSSGNLFLEGALLLDENLEVQKIAPAAWDAAASARYDAVVLDGFTPPVEAAPRTHALYLDPHGPGSPFAARGTVVAPLVTETAAAHPLLRWVTLKDLNIARASTFALAPGDVAVAAALRQPIIAARERAGRKTVAFGFDLKQSDLPLRVAFPVLVVNALDWFAGGDASLVASFSTGRPWRLPVPAGASEVDVRAPDGSRSRAPVHEGRATLLGTRVGYYELTAAGAPPRLFAANLANPAESRIAPRRELVVGGKRIAQPDPPRVGVRRAVWSYLVAAALLLLLVEWWTYNRRITV
jgi:hypothetical protein